MGECWKFKVKDELKLMKVKLLVPGFCAVQDKEEWKIIITRGIPFL